MKSNFTMVLLTYWYVPLRHVRPKLPATVLAQHPIINGSVLHFVSQLRGLDGCPKSGMLESPLVVELARSHGKLDEAGRECFVQATQGLYLLHKFFISWQALPYACKLWSFVANTHENTRAFILVLNETVGLEKTIAVLAGLPRVNHGDLFYLTVGVSGRPRYLPDYYDWLTDELTFLFVSPLEIDFLLQVDSLHWAIEDLIINVKNS